MLSCKHSLALFVPAKPLNCAEQNTCVRAWQLCTQACQGVITVAASDLLFSEAAAAARLVATVPC